MHRPRAAPSWGGGGGIPGDLPEGDHAEEALDEEHAVTEAVYHPRPQGLPPAKPAEARRGAVVEGLWGGGGGAMGGGGYGGGGYGGMQREGGGHAVLEGGCLGPRDVPDCGCCCRRPAAPLTAFHETLSLRGWRCPSASHGLWRGGAGGGSVRPVLPS